MKFQLISKNEYNDTSIVTTTTELETLVKLAREKVTEDNMANAFTMDEKLNDWETFYVEVLDEDGNPTNEAVYGGMERQKHFLYYFTDDGVKKVFLDEVTAPMRFYVGTDNEEDFFASVPSKKRVGQYDVVDNLGSEALQRKGVYYVKVLK